ncbi:hypothetical protein Aduo_000585 [Ancylostoma duodenale]
MHKRVFSSSKGLDYKDGKRHEFRVEEPHLKIPEQQRPLDIDVTIQPKIGTYEGVIERQKVFIPEEVPKFAPENMTVLAHTPVEVYIYFDPVPPEMTAGKLKGCEVYVCETKLLPPICTSKLVPRGQNEVFFTELLHGKIYHATAECLTSSGAGPRSPWITFKTMEPQPAGKEPFGTTTNMAYSRPEDIGVRVNIDVLEDMMILISWEFVMKDGSVFKQSSIKDFQVIKYKKEDAHYRSVAVITKDKNLKEIEVGLSPNYLFDTSCYFYAVNVTFQNKRRLFAPSEEMCYTFTSTSFQLLYAFIVFIFFLVAGAAIIKLFRKHQEKKKTAATKVKPDIAKKKPVDDLKPTKLKPMAPAIKGSGESITGSAEPIDRIEAPPRFSETKLREESRATKMKPGAPVFLGSRESTTRSREGISNDPPWTSKTKSAEESKPENVKAAVLLSNTGSRESARKKSVFGWLAKRKSKEQSKPMKVKPLAPKSGSLESL